MQHWVGPGMGGKSSSVEAEEPLMTSQRAQCHRLCLSLRVSIPVPLSFCLYVCVSACSGFSVAALSDFKNVSIVAHYIKERTKNAQFIIIR